MDSRYIIYGTSRCPFCISSIRLLEATNLEYVFLNMEEDIEGMEEAKRYYNHTTIPIILENNKITGKTSFIGGYDALSGMLDV
jgi:glutaredoxin